MSRTDDVYVVGCGMHPFGRDESVTGMDMAERAIREALADAGVAWEDIGYAAGGSDVSGKPDTLVGRLGLTGVPFVNVQNGCATGASTVLAVANALRAGEASLGLAVGFDKHERGAFHVSAARYGLGDWYAETGMMLTTQFFALKTRRYLYEHGISERALAMVAARAFRNGSDHPLAWRRKPLTEQEILDSAEVSPPLTQYMFCSPGQGRRRWCWRAATAPSTCVNNRSGWRRWPSGPGGSVRPRCSRPGCRQDRTTAPASTPRRRPSARQGWHPRTCRSPSCRTPTAARS